MSNELNRQLEGSLALVEKPEKSIQMGAFSQSEKIGELVSALAKAQLEFTPALKDSDNPFFKSKYADLAANINAVRPALNKHGIAVIQADSSELERAIARVRTSLHCGEQWIASEAEAPAIDKSGNVNVQTLGSAWTYLRRYTLQALCGLASEDDDGNSLSQGDGKKVTPSSVKPNPPQPAPAQAPVRGTTNTSPEGVISHEPARPTTTQQSTQQATQRAATSQQAAQPQGAQLKFIPPNGLTCVVRGVQEVQGQPASEGKRAIRPYLIITFLGMHNGCNFAYCFDTKFWPALAQIAQMIKTTHKEGVECHFQIKERDKDGTHFINLEDVLFVDGQEYIEGKPVSEGVPQ